MPFVVTMPRLGMTMEEGTINQWLKNVGEQVTQGEVLLEVLTDKVNMEVEAPVTGILQEIKAPEGETVPVDAPIAIILLPGEEPEKEEAAGEVTSELPLSVPPVKNVPIPQKKAEAVKATPAARYLAKQIGIDLKQVEGSGAAGEIYKKDLERELPQLEVRPGFEELPLSGIRKTIAERMFYNYSTIPHVTLCTEAEVSDLVGFWNNLKPVVQRAAGRKLSFTPLMAYFVARVLVRHPRVNATLDDGVIRRYETVNLGVAVDTDQGLLVPVIHGADRMSLGEIVKAVDDKIERAKAGKLTAEDASRGTFTISNLGMFAIDFFTPIINAPEVAILGIGRIKDIYNHHVLGLSLSFDHRVLDGAPAARFLQELKHVLENPETVLV